MKKHLFGFIIFFTLSACNYIEEHSSPHVKTLHPPGKNEITTVGILPFTNESGEKGAAEALRICFFANLSTKGYNVLKLEEVDERLNLAALNPSNLYKKEDMYKIGRIVKADAVIYGTVSKCCRRFFGVYSQVVLGAEIKMVNTRTSEVIWQANHTEKTHSDSIPLSPFSIPQAVVESSINVREKVVVDTADRLAKKFIASIPGKVFSSFIHADTISIRHNGSTLEVCYRVRPGDTLSAISERFYDDASRAEEISRFNKGISNVTLKAGQELVIPGIPVIKDIEESQQLDKKIHRRTVYRVKWGDSLYNIASRVFHDGKRWTVIYDVNKHEIRDVKDLPVGQVIIIPLTIPQSDSFKKDI